LLFIAIAILSKLSKLIKLSKLNLRMRYFIIKGDRS